MSNNVNYKVSGNIIMLLYAICYAFRCYRQFSRGYFSIDAGFEVDKSLHVSKCLTVLVSHPERKHYLSFYAIP